MVLATASAGLGLALVRRASVRDISAGGRESSVIGIRVFICWRSRLDLV
jgi:hypothetical protein